MNDDRETTGVAIPAAGSSSGPGIGRGDVPANIEEIMHDAYLQYSLSVNVGRAVPDVRDGLKPGMRRILYAMKRLGLTKSHAYTKCAKVVGEVIGNYHPHGDQAVYDTIVRMAQDFSMSLPLIDGQGNFGSIDGDAPAAYRYTECRMERVAEELLTDIDKNTVDMQPNFDESTEEPIVLPAAFPNLLVNGSTGIGVGMATNIPPHNLTEVINAAILLLDKPLATAQEIMQVMPGPDLPTGATITGVNSIIQLYETGRGSIRMRGKAEIEEAKGRERIIITEIPYGVNKESMVLKIADLVKTKKITGISGLNDESSSRTGIRVVVEIKKNAMASIVLNQIYRHTLLERTFGAHFLVVDHNRPKTMNVRQLLQAYIDHRLEVITRRTRFELEKAEARAHILEGLLVGVDNLDELIALIRQSRTREEADEAIIARFGFTERQSRAILNMRLHQLTALAIEDLQEEHDDLLERISYYKDLLSNRKLRLGVLKEELIQIRDKYPVERRTEIVPGERELNIEDLIAQSVWVVTVSATGYIKRVSSEIYQTQNRGGIGVRGMKTKEEDHVEHLITVRTHDYVLFFTSTGRMHWLKAYEIPEGGRTGRGRAIVNLVDLDQDEQIRAIISVPEVDVEGQYVVMATKNGFVKKTALNAFRHLRSPGIRAIKLEDDDDLITAKLTDGQQQLLLSSRDGKACRFRESDVREMGRVTRGVRGMELRGEDGEPTTSIVAMAVVNPDADLLVITAGGMGKRTHLGTGIAEQDRDLIGGYRLTNRNGKGVISIRLKENDYVVAVLLIEEDQDIVMMSVQGQMVRISTENIRPIGRSSQGVRIMRLRENDQLSSVSKMLELEEEETEGADEEGEAADREEPEESSSAAVDAGSEEEPEASSEQEVEI